LHEDNPAGRKEWRHIVFIRQAFYSRRARGWVFGVQDSLKGRIEYYTWKRLRNLADSVHYLEVPGLRPQATGDADDLLARAAQRKLPGNIFIQQEQEGNLFNPDLRDSSGDVFRYYRPTELSAALAAKIDLGLRWFEKPGYWLRRALGGRGTYAAWNAWPLRAKLAYLDALEKDVARERGDAAVWDGKVFLLLERGPSAPAYVARHPHMEPAPASREEGPYARFSQPEIVSAKDSPAHSVLEALGRTRRVIAETGHAGTQYHVFMKVEPQTVEEQWPRLQQALQLVNDSLFAHVLEGGDWRDLVHESLGPWHAGRSRRAARLIEERGGAAASLAEDPDSEKHAFVGLRYWGLEDGKLLLSLELRGASLPWKSRPPVAVRMDAPVEKQERDYSQASRYLALLSLLAQGLVEGRLPELGYSLAPESGLAQADAALTAAARRKQMSRSSYYDMRALWRAFGGSGAVAPGLLHPFAVNPFDPAVQSLADALLERSLELRHSTIERNGLDEQARRFFQHRLLRAYRDWALAFARRANGRVDALLRSIAL
ncbi:MAG: hypothetical protein KGK30_06795, partial [Elusimicrobia bacterium]|nr:hypothetical protein [Elusimicrobiota bacterium]